MATARNKKDMNVPRLYCATFNRLMRLIIKMKHKIYFSIQGNLNLNIHEIWQQITDVPLSEQEARRSIPFFVLSIKNSTSKTTSKTCALMRRKYSVRIEKYLFSNLAQVVNLWAVFASQMTWELCRTFNGKTSFVACMICPDKRQAETHGK